MAVCRVPVDSVQLQIKNLAGDFVWVSPRRSQNNQWVWPGDVVQKRWSDSDYPMPIRITSVAGETVQDVITGPGVSTTTLQTPCAVVKSTCGGVLFLCRHTQSSSDLSPACVLATSVCVAPRELALVPGQTGLFCCSLLETASCPAWPVCFVCLFGL
jgi:hypothetical protein